MALKATVHRASLQVSDLDRHYYATHTLTLAQHPSETDARLMVRLLCFGLFAAERLEFGRGISSDGEPDLWLRSLTGEIEHWIELGQPDEAAIAAFQGADLILMNGATYSKWADKITLPESKVVDTSAVFAVSLIQVNETSTHSHGPGGEHSHSGTAFTTWIDLTQAVQQAEAVKTALAKFTPDAEKNFAALKSDLEALDA